MSRVRPLLLFLYVAFFLHSVCPNNLSPSSNKRKVNWFTNRELVDFNFQFYQQHADVISGYYPCCMCCGVALNGSFVLQDSPEFIEKWTQPYLARGVQIFPVITPGSDEAMREVQKAPSLFIQQAVSLSLRFNFSGFVFDYEGNGGENEASLYSSFLSLFAEALHRKGKTLGVCVASWGYLSYYSWYANSSVDFLMNMATYFPTSQTYLYADWLLGNLTNKERAVFGIATPLAPSHSPLSPSFSFSLALRREKETNWDEKSLRLFLSYISSRGVNEIDIWWCPTNSSSSPPSFFFSLLRLFLSGGI
eukprot:TRINITY_DN10074_c0_g1_i1.p1 TRINITY_DN10074_c0_g1~~TRINITY_DN10074_c0_g1_i1.p1  ORF type:complete len:306 (+),score=60.31 TRINITY_DN10074_c0_g1_i1:231-1148(+)